ncbi:hypothetical protein [Clostridium estertheticum]|uniref:hypothetical protein n=1 Tax=Clostridium estertheticum TaxID=238834 RepID=UPI001C0B1D49|nr:hypothetical protein [Clostridium estertheticum]MBU3186575.1 hypothetical protein [Clostridium estertheticum]
MDELDDYICPACGCPGETCHCLEDYNNRVFDDSEDYEYDDDELGYEGDCEPVCLLNGEPLYIEDIDLI